MVFDLLFTSLQSSAVTAHTHARTRFYAMVTLRKFELYSGIFETISQETARQVMDELVYKILTTRSPDIVR